MRAAVRPSATAVVALAVASVVTVTPIAPRPSEIHIANQATRLATLLSGLDLGDPSTLLSGDLGSMPLSLS